MAVSIVNPVTHSGQTQDSCSRFPLDQWYVAALGSQLKDKPVGRTLLNKSVVLFRTADGQVAALDNRCCHRALPLSDGTLEAQGIRCGYHGLLYDGQGKCIEIPGQDKVPVKALVSAWHVRERDQIVWIWFGNELNPAPTHEPPAYAVHSSGKYLFDGGLFHYEAPWQLVHDNLMDLSHLGYVHLKTIGGNASLHMNAKMMVQGEGDTVRVVRHMPDSEPPPTYSAAYPFKGRIDRWQEIEFFVNHLRIWTGGVDQGTDALDDPDRGGFHMRGFHGITPETETTCHYFWTMATNPTQDHDAIKAKVINQTVMTFEEDKVIIESQYRNMCTFGELPAIDIHVDVGANRARRIVQRLCQVSS